VLTAPDSRFFPAEVTTEHLARPPKKKKRRREKEKDRHEMEKILGRQRR
jgi:hypothetical protein